MYSRNAAPSGVLRILVVVGAVLAMLAALAPAASATPSASAVGGQSKICLPVRLTGEGGGLPDQGDGKIRTQADIRLAGFLVATTEATFSPGAGADTILPFAGPIVFMPRSGHSTFTAQVAGSLDVTTGEFRAESTSVTGTDGLQALSGSLVFAGTQNLATGEFTESIKGSLCGRVRPW